MNLFIITEKNIITNVPEITGKIMYSRDTSANNAIKGFAAAGGWTTFKYIINVTVTPTDKANDTVDIPINSLNKIPTIIPIRWPKKIFPGWANSLSYKTKTIREVAPNDIISQKPKDVSKLKKANIPIIIDEDRPIIRGSNFLFFFIYFFSN